MTINLKFEVLEVDDSEWRKVTALTFPTRHAWKVATRDMLTEIVS